MTTLTPHNNTYFDISLKSIIRKCWVFAESRDIYRNGSFLLALLPMKMMAKNDHRISKYRNNEVIKENREELIITDMGLLNRWFTNQLLVSITKITDAFVIIAEKPYTTEEK